MKIFSLLQNSQAFNKNNTAEHYLSLSLSVCVATIYFLQQEMSWPHNKKTKSANRYCCVRYNINKKPLVNSHGPKAETTTAGGSPSAEFIKDHIL